MVNEFSEKVIRATRMLSEAEKSERREIMIEKFLRGIEPLKDCLEEQPNNKKIRNTIKSYTKAILLKAIDDLRGFKFKNEDIYTDVLDKGVLHDYLIIFRKVNDIIEEIANEQPGLKDIKEVRIFLYGMKNWGVLLEDATEEEWEEFLADFD